MEPKARYILRPDRWLRPAIAAFTLTLALVACRAPPPTVRVDVASDGDYLAFKPETLCVCASLAIVLHGGPYAGTFSDTPPCIPQSGDRQVAAATSGFGEAGSNGADAYPTAALAAAAVAIHVLVLIS